MKLYAPILLAIVLFTSCQKDDETPISNYKLIFKFVFDSTQTRLNNIGQPATLPAGNAALSPVFNGMSAHYIELAPNANTLLGQGQILYKAPETTIGGNTAIDFSQSTIVANGGTFFSIPINNINLGSYEWLRVSLAYQNYDIKYHIDTTVTTPLGNLNVNQVNTGTVASFIGFNTYIGNLKIKNESLAINGNRTQGFWAFETSFNLAGNNYIYKDSAQAPANATTVVNPIQATSPIPAGSCVVTASFKPGKLVITGNETSDIIVEVSLSTNKSFEWKEKVNNGLWDPLKGEQVVDMGIRGMIPTLK